MRFKVEWGEREKGLKKHSVDLESSYPKYMKGIGDKQLNVRRLWRKLASEEIQVLIRASSWRMQIRTGGHRL